MNKTVKTDKIFAEKILNMSDITKEAYVHGWIMTDDDIGRFLRTLATTKDKDLLEKYLNCSESLFKSFALKNPLLSPEELEKYICKDYLVISSILHRKDLTDRLVSLIIDIIDYDDLNERINCKADILIEEIITCWLGNFEEQTLFKFIFKFNVEATDVDDDLAYHFETSKNKDILKKYIEMPMFKSRYCRELLSNPVWTDEERAELNDKYSQHIEDFL